MNEKKKLIILQTKNFARQLQTHYYVEFSQNVGCKIVVMISFKMRNLGSEIFIESGFRMVIAALADHATFQKIAKPCN